MSSFGLLLAITQVNTNSMFVIGPQETKQEACMKRWEGSTLTWGVCISGTGSFTTFSSSGAFLVAAATALRTTKVRSTSPMESRVRPSSWKRAGVMYSALFLGNHSLRIRPRSVRKIASGWHKDGGPGLACTVQQGDIVLTFATELGDIFKQTDNHALVLEAQVV